jgi:WD40 repeat protein
LAIYRAAKDKAHPEFKWLRSLRASTTNDGHQSLIRQHAEKILFSPNSEQLLTMSKGGGSIQVWDASSTMRVRLAFQSPTSKNLAMDFSPSGTLFAIAYDEGFYLYDLLTPAHFCAIDELNRPFKRARPSKKTAVTFDHTSFELILGCEDGSLHFWDIESLTHSGYFRAHRKPITKIAASQDGRYLATASLDKTVRIWHEPSLRRAAILRIGAEILDIVFSATKQLLYVVTDEGLTAWRYETWQQQDTGIANPRDISSIAVSHDDRVLVAGTIYGRLFITSEPSFDPQAHDVHHLMIRSVAISPANDLIATASGDGTVNIHAAARIRSDHLKGDHDWFSIDAMMFSPDGNHLATAGGDSICIWNSTTGTRDAVIHTPDGILRCLVYGPESTYIASGSYEGIIRIWHNQQYDHSLVCKHAKEVTALAVLPHSSHLVSASQDRTIRLWDVYTGRQLACFSGHSDAITALSASPDGRYIASASSDRTVRVWDVVNRRCHCCFRRHRASVLAVRFSPNCTHVLSAAEDGIVSLWDIPRRHPVYSLDHHQHESVGGGVDSGPVDAIAFSPDGLRFLTQFLGDTYTWETISRTLVDSVVGTGDIEALANGDRSWRMLTHLTETIVQCCASRDIVARLPLSFDRVTSHPTRPIWAGSQLNRLHLYSLEES